MSSFRIDRQYVSFVSTEAHSVITDSKHPESSVAADKNKEAIISADKINKQYEQIKAKALKEADERANEILAKAENDAKKVTADAEKRAASIVEEAKNKAEQMKNIAKSEGHSEGLKNAEKAFEIKRKEDQDALAICQKSLNESYSSLVDGLRDEILTLVFSIVKKIINIKLNESDEVFVNMVNSAVDELKHAGSAAVHINAEDYKLYFGKNPAIFDGNGKVSIVEEEEFSRGDLVVESDGEILDYSVGRQLERLEKVFREAGRS